MKNKEVVAYEQRLDNLFKQARTFSPDDEVVLKHWPRYLCVLASGYLETSVRALLMEYVEKRSSGLVKNYTRRQLERLQNPTFNKICELLQGFSLDWERDFREKVGGELGDAINSLMTNRHSIAHGKDQSISLGVVENYCTRSKRAMEILEEMCDPS